MGWSPRTRETRGFFEGRFSTDIIKLSLDIIRTQLLGGEWLPSIWHFPINLGLRNHHPNWRSHVFQRGAWFHQAVKKGTASKCFSQSVSSQVETVNWNLSSCSRCTWQVAPWQRGWWSNPKRQHRPCRSRTPPATFLRWPCSLEMESRKALGLWFFIEEW